MGAVSDKQTTQGYPYPPIRMGEVTSVLYIGTQSILVTAHLEILMIILYI